jgi:enoyl-CoA hydratase
MTYQSLLYQEPEPGIGLVTLNRPECLNAIHFGLLDDFHALCQDLSDRAQEVRVLIVTGAGRGFCAGADLSNINDYLAKPELFGTPALFLANVQKKYSRLMVELRKIPQVVISAVNGPAAGGGMCLALAADVIYAAPEAYFMASFINIGLTGGELGSSYFLTRSVGSVRAREILMTGRKVHAEEAERIGMINQVVLKEQLVDTALATARVMLTKSVMGLRHTKEVIDQNLEAPSFEAAVELENRNQTIGAFSGDFMTAVNMFQKK